MKRLFVTTSIGGLGLCALLLVPLQGCTDLNETPISSITPSNFFHTPGEVLAALAGVYAGLRNTASEGEYWGVSEVSTDEMVVPTRDSTFRFIESELLAIRPNLPKQWGDTTLLGTKVGRVTKGAVNALLANMYINARVFKNEGAGSGISATSYNTCQGVTVSGPKDACQAAIDVADSIINSGVYQLAPAFTDNFSPDNATSPENIFVIKFADADGLGFNMVMRTLHYNQFTPSPWNGFATLEQTYNAFDSLDQRRKMFLVDTQVNVETGRPATDRKGNPLVFTTTIANVTSATEGEGARIYKWPADPKHVQQRSEEHTSELQSQSNIVCRLLLEKKK